MILKSDLKPKARKKIQTVLKDYPGILKLILNHIEWEDFITRLHVRCNELELQGIIRARKHLDEIVHAAVCTFSLNVLDKYASAPKREKARFKEVAFTDYTTNRKV